MIYYDLTVFEDPVEEVFEEDNFETLGNPIMEEKHRWITRYTQVLREKSTGHYWMASWFEGNTEYQDCDPDLTLVKVAPYEVTITQYRLAKE